MATTLRNDAKSEIIKILRKQGYRTYANLVDYFDIFLTDDPEVIGYMIPGQAKIVLNKDLNIDQVSTIVRHEILHEYLTHGPRQQEFDKAHPELNPHLAPHELSNIAADFEISNKGYTDADKSIARSIKLGDKILRALVTEDQHPDWVDLSYEEMYKRLLEQDKDDRQQIQDLINQMQQLSKQDLDDLMQDAQNVSDQMSDQGQEQQQGQSGASSPSNQSPETDDSEQQGGGEPSPEEIKDAAEKAKKAAGELKDKAAEADQQSERSEGVFNSPEEQRDKVDVAARVKQIRDFIDNLERLADIKSENAKAISKEKAAKSAADVNRYMGSGLQQFKMNLNRFIVSQIEEMGEPEDTYRVLDPRYEDSDFLMPGKITRQNKQIPIINVYHDNSGSFDDVRKTAAAFKAIETLNKYVRDGDLQIKLFYFGNKVSDKKSGTGGGTYGTPILDHIEQTKPTNVIVITDADIHDCSRVVKVPGAVWMLFYDARSENLMEHLKGKRQTKYYDIEYK